MVRGNLQGTVLVEGTEGVSFHTPVSSMARAEVVYIRSVFFQGAKGKHLSICPIRRSWRIGVGYAQRVWLDVQTIRHPVARMLEGPGQTNMEPKQGSKVESAM